MQGRSPNGSDIRSFRPALHVVGVEHGILGRLPHAVGAVRQHVAHARARTCPSGRGTRTCGRTASPSPSAGVLDEPRAVRIGDDVRQRRERRERRRQHHRTRARAAAAMRRREGLVQVDVHGVDAEIAGPHLADDGVEVGAVRIEIGAGRVHRLGDRHDVALEQAAGVGVGQHDGGDVRREMLLHLLRIDRAVRRAPASTRRDSRAAPRSPDWCRAPNPAPARSSASRRAPRAPP